MNNLKPKIIPTFLASMFIAGTALLFVAISMQSGSRYVSVGHTMSKRVILVPYEQALVDYCAALSEIKGVTGVSYRDYDILEKTAVVTVHYNPWETTPQQIRTYFGNTRSIWGNPVKA